jgi:hypothetical protein
MKARLSHRIEIDNIMIKVVLVAKAAFLVMIPFRAETGEFAGEFLARGFGVRAHGLGGAFCALADDGTAHFWNPAGLLKLDQREMVFLSEKRFGGLVECGLLSFGQSFSFKRNAFGVSIVWLRVSDISISGLEGQEWDEGYLGRPVKIKKISANEYAIYLSYARRLWRSFYIGGNLKVLRQVIGGESSLGYGFDLGVLWKPIRVLQLGLSIQDIVKTSVKWTTGQEDLIPPNVKFGVAFILHFPKVGGKLSLSGDADTRYGQKLCFGIEYLWYDSLVLRAGLDDGSFTGGLGLIISVFEVDYVFRPHALGETHGVSLTLRF